LRQNSLRSRRNCSHARASGVTGPPPPSPR
jgi:hypothetical protein